MPNPLDRLFDLLPAYYKRLDAGQGGPLQGLLQLITAQAIAIEADIARLYDDQFIETCQPWVAPYLGDLVGYDPIEAPGTIAESALLSPRADVADTIRVRRRKGTLAVLEQIARDVGGWPAVAVELAQRVGRFVSVHFADKPVPWQWRRSPASGFLDVRDPGLARTVGTPFARGARMAEVRRVSATAPFQPGQANLAGVALYAYRLQAVPAGPAPARRIDTQRFTFDPHGYDVPLFTRPQAPPDRDAPPADAFHIPAPIRRGMLPVFGAADPTDDAATANGYYGVGASFYILFPDPHDALWPKLAVDDVAYQIYPMAGASAASLGYKVFPAATVAAANLADWAADTSLPDGAVLVDPQLGRLMVAADLAQALDGYPKLPLLVNYHYGTPDTLGAGGQPWDPIATDTAPEPDPVTDGGALMAAVATWKPDTQPAILLELGSDGFFDLPDTPWVVPAGCTLHIRAARVVADDSYRTRRPILRPAGAATGRLHIHLEPGHPADPNANPPRPAPVVGSRLILEGVLLADLTLVIDAATPPPPTDYFPGELVLRHVTMIASTTTDADSALPAASSPILSIDGLPVRVAADRCLLAPIHVSRGSLTGAPVCIAITDSIVDAGAADAYALADPHGCHAPAALTLDGVTVNGRIETHAMPLVENSLLLGRVHVARRQQGCVRYSYVEYDAPGDIRTPRRYQCQPDLALAAQPPRPVASVRPTFTSRQFGDPGYFQLASSAAAAITGGADDEGEMGASHRLLQPRRAARLRARLAQFIPTGFDVALIFVT